MDIAAIMLEIAERKDREYAPLVEKARAVVKRLERRQCDACGGYEYWEGKQVHHTVAGEYCPIGQLQAEIERVAGGQHGS